MWQTRDPIVIEPSDKLKLSLSDDYVVVPPSELPKRYDGENVIPILDRISSYTRERLD